MGLTTWPRDMFCHQGFSSICSGCMKGLRLSASLKRFWLPAPVKGLAARLATLALEGAPKGLAPAAFPNGDAGLPAALEVSHRAQTGVSPLGLDKEVAFERDFQDQAQWAENAVPSSTIHTTAELSIVGCGKPELKLLAFEVASFVLCLSGCLISFSGTFSSNSA